MGVIDIVVAAGTTVTNPLIEHAADSVRPGGRTPVVTEHPVARSPAAILHIIDSLKELKWTLEYESVEYRQLGRAATKKETIVSLHGEL